MLIITRLHYTPLIQLSQGNGKQTLKILVKATTGLLNLLPQHTLAESNLLEFKGEKWAVVSQGTRGTKCSGPNPKPSGFKGSLYTDFNGLWVRPVIYSNSHPHTHLSNVCVEEISFQATLAGSLGGFTEVHREG